MLDGGAAQSGRGGGPGRGRGGGTGSKKGTRQIVRRLDRRYIREGSLFQGRTPPAGSHCERTYLLEWLLRTASLGVSCKVSAAASA